MSYAFRAARSTAKTNSKTAVFSFLAAILTVIGASIGLFVAVSTIVNRDGVIAQRDQDIESLRQKLTSAEATLTARQDAITSLRDENTKLRAAVPYTVAPEDTHPIRKVAPITLAKNGDTIDLNSALANFRPTGTTWNDTLSFNGEEIKLGFGVSALTLSQGLANYDTCEAATGWEQTYELDPHILSKPTTCLRLHSNRYAVVQVRKYDSEKADLTITVWE